MVKTIKLFFSEAPLWLVFFLTCVLFTISIDFVIITINIITRTTSLISFELFRLSFFISILLGMIVSMFTSISRNSHLFWDEAERLACKIDNAEDKDILLQIYDEDFENLKKLSCGAIHNEELRRLYTIIKTKYKYLK